MNRFYSPIIAGLGATLAIGVLLMLELQLQDIALLMAPFGATTVLVFGLPKSPLAQPKNVILGHLLTATIGVAFVQLIGVTAITIAIATGLAVTAMMLTKTTHPPAGANPILVMLSGQSWGFLVTPVLIGAVLIVVIGKLVNRVRQD